MNCSFAAAAFSAATLDASVGVSGRCASPPWRLTLWLIAATCRVGVVSPPKRKLWTLSWICCGVAVRSAGRARAGARDRLERDLAHAQALRADQQVCEIQDLGRAAQPRVGLDRLAEDLLELAEVAGQLGAVLLLDGEQEALVAGIADLRGVGVAVGDELLGLAAVEALVSGLQIDVLVLVAAVGVVVVVALIDRVVHATERVDRVLELGERRRDHVVDRQPRDLLDRLQERRRPVRVGRVEPVRVRRRRPAR